MEQTQPKVLFVMDEAKDLPEIWPDAGHIPAGDTWGAPVQESLENIQKLAEEGRKVAIPSDTFVCAHGSAVKWNEYNKVVQCHRCGEIIKGDFTDDEASVMNVISNLGRAPSAVVIAKHGGFLIYKRKEDRERLVNAINSLLEKGLIVKSVKGRGYFSLKNYGH